ncbi:MAG: hypothetical protein M5U01_05690 [Ardenticatenaceae bacterium]|nr:hypothetical protein [Ardenticatenaceae bacterium]
MVRIELTQDEARMLREILRNDLSDLRMEIAATERMEFRQSLKEIEVFLKDLLQRLEA